MAIEFMTEVQYNQVHVIQSLPAQECQTGRRLAFDTLKQICAGTGTDFRYSEVHSRTDFRQVLDSVKGECLHPEAPRFPILHFEIHGFHDAKGLLLDPTGEVMLWSEFADLCREINRASSNYLLCVLAVCYGYRSILSTSIKDVTPFCWLIGPEHEVSAGTVADGFPRFYESLFRDGDVNEAMAVLGTEFQRYDCQKLFLQSFVRYWLRLCTGKGAQFRVEDLVTRAKHKLPGISLPHARKVIKGRIRPTAREFDKLKNRFLMADDLRNSGRFDVTFSDVEAIVTSHE